MADPIRLAAEARPIIAKLHGRGDVVVRFKTDSSGYAEDRLSLEDVTPGHFKPDEIVLSLNLDQLITKGKPHPTSLATIEDFRKYPVLAGVAAHESAHARFSLWGTALGDQWPDSLPNPDFDPDKPELGPAEFPLARSGQLEQIAEALEEPRVERLGTGNFSKTWRRAMQFSATHFVLERVDADDANDRSPLDAALSLAILVGGRIAAGTLGSTFESRKAIEAVLKSAQEIIESSLPETEDPYHKVMGIINESVFSNDHTSAEPHLERARQILAIIHPEQKDDPDKSDGEGEGEGSGPGEGEGEGDGDGEGSGSGSGALKEMADQMRKSIDALGTAMQDAVESEMDAPEEQDGGGGYGSTLYRNPQAPQVDHYENPNSDDRALYKRALSWMEQQVEPTVTTGEYGQWLPTGGARLDVRRMLRDNLAGIQGSQRSDWRKVSETVRPAPPVKVAVMLDGSGSMHAMARPSASIAWAAANAAADLPESRTVSVVYGNAAQVTQMPGHVAAKQVAVSRTDGGTEDFIGAAQMVEDALWLDEPVEDGEKSNVLIIIVSDLQYGGYSNGRRGGEGQMDGFMRITKDWHERGYRTLVVGAAQNALAYNVSPRIQLKDIKEIEIVTPSELFR